MKSIISKKIAFITLLAMFTACDFGDMNVNPNEPTDVPAESLVTNAMFSLSNRYWDRAVNFEMAMLFVQHFAQAEYTEEQRYVFNNSSFNNMWSGFYAAELANIQAARQLIEADEEMPANIKANQIAVLDIIESFAFHAVTDLWGDVPYSEALNPDEFFQPKYDAQSSIYEALINKVSNAVGSINTGSPGFSATGDIIFNGDMEGWEKFGNAFLLRLGMRISDANSTLASTTVSSALSGNIISSVSEEATLVFSETQEIANPFWYDASPAGGSRDDFRVTEELLDMMKDMGDPRVEKYADSTATGEYVGLPYGMGDGDSFAMKNSTSRFALSIRQPTAPAYLLRYSEVKFLEAEAIERGFVSGDAEAAFNEAVTASMNEWGITDTGAINAYLAANPYDAANWDESIGTHMWIALYTNGMEAWSTWRRLDYPELEPAVAAVDRNYIPVRGLYPTTEEATNSENLLAVGYVNEMNVKVWWDVD
jgi:hypothetical protein